MDALTVTNALGTNALGSNAAQAASPVTIDAVFGALLESMSDTAAMAPPMPGVAPMNGTELFAPQSTPSTQTTSLASIVTLLQNGSDVTGEGSSDQSAYQTMYQATGALIVPASSLSDNTDNDATPAGTIAPPQPIVPAPQTAKAAAPANQPAEQTDVAAASVAPAAQTDEGAPETTAAPVTMPVPMPATPAKDAAPQQADAAPTNDNTQADAAATLPAGTTDTPPVKPQTGKTAAAPQPKSDAADATNLAMVMPAPVQVAPVKLQTAAPNDDDAVPANDDSSKTDSDTTSTEQNTTQAAPAPVAVAVAVPTPAAPVQPSKPASESTQPVTMAAPKPVRAPSDTPDDTAAPEMPTGKPAVRDASVPHPAVKADAAPQPKTSEQSAATSDQPQTSALRSAPDPVPAANNNSNAAPQPDAQPAATQHQSPAPSAIPVINPALSQTTPSGLRQLTAGLQIAAQEHDTTATLDKFGVSIVTKAVEGLRHFDIRLDPPELGRVEVRLTVDDSGKAQANLVVDKPQTLELLQRDQTNLNRALSDAGLDLSNNGLNFSLREQDRQNDGGTDQGRGRHLSAKAVVQTDITPVHSSLGSYAPDSVRLDIRV